ncbi:hypothetical protein F5876DRAFT_90615 [Lentinula aff. lateritia]|uniref:Uncharacterized protein n=1 Tax=Lentinula aff. lateritia TaxID=2804960 RepID=A0ACC1TRH5_9AGAR|nr:hypothetical protein F5876DRAFT_90615 [Lentinula aff. lateritia]
MDVDDIGVDVGFGDDEGGEGVAENTEDVSVDIRDVIQVGRWHGRRKYKDGRTWKYRIQTLNAAWAPLIEEMSEAYIKWKYSFGLPETFDESYSFSISVVDALTLVTEATISRGSDTRAAIALVHAGYIGTSPEKPSLAVSLKTLELYYTLRLFKPSLSIEAFAKTICHLYSVPYRRGYRTGLSNTFDIYLAIRRKVDAQVAKELGHDSANYRVLNSCPACCYKLEDEPELKFSRMWAVDGNNSLKRVAGIGSREVSDNRVFEESDYYLSKDFVNTFAGEIKARTVSLVADEDPDEWVDEEHGDPTDGTEDASQCTENWKAAAADQHKKMWSIFDESGYFVSSCRHGFVLWVTDMIRSGELAKYPLAVVAMALKVLPPGWIMGYDIGCSFEGTIQRSSLGPEFAKQGCRTCVNAFHGQHKYHPLNILGMGLEDLETLERLFSSSNQLAPITRYMTAYRRRVFIDIFLQQWDREKYQNLATMLHNNYVQALDVLEEEAQALQADLLAKGISVEDLEAYFIDKANHLKEMGKEVEGDLHALAYVELLQRYREVNVACENAAGDFRSQTPADYQFLASAASYDKNLSDGRRTETKQRYLREQRDKLLFEVVQMESAMSISRRWEPSDKEYLETLKYMNARKYHQALEQLYKLVIQHLFELHKMNLSFTGYKMRTHISNALQRRSKAIRNAVKTYNNAAAAIGRPTLDWTKVTHYTFLDQFNILQDTRHSVLDKKWADPIVRHLMRQHRRVLRAKEELRRCNIEIRRVHTSILNEEHEFDETLRHLETHPVCYPVREYIDRRRAVNRLLLSRIHQTQALPGFTGDKTPGTCRGFSDPDLSSELVELSLPDPDSDDGEDADDDEMVHGVGAVIEFMSNLST